MISKQCQIPSPPTNQIAMSNTINCSFARVSVRSLTSKHSSRKRISGSSFSRILEDFNKQFRGYSSFKIDEATAKKRFPIVNKAFNRRWHPADARNQYETFSPSAWKLFLMLKSISIGCEIVRPIKDTMVTLQPCFLQKIHRARYQQARMKILSQYTLEGMQHQNK